MEHYFEDSSPTCLRSWSRLLVVRDTIPDVLLMHMGWLLCDGVGYLRLCNLLFVLLSFEATKLFPRTSQ